MGFQTHSVTGRGHPASKTPSGLGKWMWGIFLVLLAGGLFWGTQEYYFQSILEKPNEGSEELTLFEIPLGSTLGEISEKLETENFLTSSWAFEKYVKKQNAAEDFLSGRFYLGQNLTIPDVAAKLLDSEKREEFFTVPEGLTIQEIDERIAEKGFAEEGIFLECIQATCDFSEFSFLPADRAAWEGYFFPETYAVHPGNFSAEELGAKMLTEFEKRAKKLGILERDDLAEIVNMASMIEEESREAAERPIISGILWKRLDEGWTLGVDATVRYFTAKQTETLTNADLETDNPYNTRKNTGLPPTAICNPSESSLQAAANPEDSPYYYYLHGNDGKIYYATTNEEHNLNKQRYL